MPRSSPTGSLAIIKPTDNTLDDEIKMFASRSLGEVVYHSEHGLPRIGRVNGNKTAKEHLASQMYTDAIFNQDIRVIQLIINRIDAGLPKDVDVDDYQTMFGDCINEVLEADSTTRLTIGPDDSVMLALCKSLYDLAVREIYVAYKEDDDGRVVARQKNPSSETKQTRDAALRLILERAGGRKTLASIPKEAIEVGIADWILELAEEVEDVKK